MEYLTLFFYYIKADISGNYVSGYVATSFNTFSLPLSYIGKAGIITAHGECRNHFEPHKKLVWKQSLFFIWFAEITHLTYKKLVYIVLHWTIPPSKPYKKSKTSSHLITILQCTPVADKLNKFTLISKLISPCVLARFSIHPDVFTAIKQLVHTQHPYHRPQGLYSI